jgi:hypothetical protein
MTPLTPIVTESYVAYIGDVIKTTLTFAIWLTDEVTQQGPVGSVKVIIKGGNRTAVRNLSGYFLFTDLTPGTYTVRVESEFYFPAEQTVDTTSLNPKQPVAGIVLKPTPSYPFPGSATLLRGVVTNGTPLPDAKVSVTGKTITTVTNERGEFILFFAGIKKEAITVVIQKGANSKSVAATIEEGKTASTGTIHFP